MTHVRVFRERLAQQTGLRFPDDKLPFLEELLSTRLARRGASPEQYLEQLLHRADEIEALARALSVSETYFLRNRDQFRAFEAIVAQRQATPARHLRVLSAGCSSGEEPYTVAMLLAETLRQPAEWSIEIVGVDWNPDVIEKARAARYPAWSLRDMPDSLRSKYFAREDKGFVLSPALRDMVRFEQHNLAHPPAGWWRPASYDVVFCRNVTMYLTTSAARRLVAEIHRALAPGGYLFLGHAENLRGLSEGFELEHTHGTFYYRRRDGAHVAPAPPPAAVAPAAPAVRDDSWLDIIQQASQRIEHIRRGAAETRAVPQPARAGELSVAMDLMQQERFRDALGVMANLDADEEPHALLLRSMLLVGTGDVTGAEQLCRSLLARDDLSAGAHYVMAICREHAGDVAAAREHSQAAAYLDAEFAMPHVQLGRLARRTGDFAEARRELSVALELLPREDGARIVLFGGGFGRKALMRLCESEMRACGGLP